MQFRARFWRTTTVLLAPSAAAYDPTNSKIFVACENNASLSVINATSNKLETNILLGILPAGVMYDPLNGLIYVAGSYPGNVTIIDPSSNAVINSIDYYRVFAITLDPKNNLLYAATENMIIVISGTNVIDQIPTGEGPAIAFDSANGDVIVTNFDYNSISIINSTTNTVSGTMAVEQGPISVFYDSYNGYVYVANEKSGTISVISLS